MLAAARNLPQDAPVRQSRQAPPRSSNPRHWFLLLALLFGSACEREANLDNPVQYTRNGVQFSMPGNWTVTEDEAENGFRYLFIETPGDAIVVVTIYAIEDSVSLREYTDWAIDSTLQDFPIGSRDRGAVTEIRKAVGDRVHEGFRNEFVVSVAGIDVPHTATYFGVATNSRVAYLSTQVASEDLQKVEPGFDLVISTFELQ